MKKAFTLVELLGVIIVLGVISLIVFPIVDKSIKTSKEDSLNSIIKTIEKAAQEYLVHEHMGYTTSYDKVYLDELIATGYLKDNIINPVTNEKMNGCVIYKWQSEYNQYQYEYDEECHMENNLISTLLGQYKEGETTGLVKDSTNPNLYYYTGTNEEIANNFLWYGGHQWRVLEFDTSANTLTLVTQQPLTSIYPANAVWETQEMYDSSYINTWLNDYFWNSLDSSIQRSILDNNFNVGIYTDVDEITTNQKVGLLDKSQYERAGITNSFLDINDMFWLGNRYNITDNYGVFNGNFVNINPNEFLASFGVRAVIKICDLIISGGDGTIVDSYRIENKATNTNNVQVGEYINVPYRGDDNACGNDNMCTFRVISKNNDSIKVVLNGLLPTTSEWADSESDNITVSGLIYTNVLNPFIENIDSKFITTGTYGVGMYEEGNSYTVPQITTITTKVGLPTVGEMFSGNDIDMYETSPDENKTFVDVNTIENPTSDNTYWTNNRSRLSSVRVVREHGYYSGANISYPHGVRPVIFLKKNLTFTGGIGTAQSPYTLE